jgi:hypothetical protein
VGRLEPIFSEEGVGFCCSINRPISRVSKCRRVHIHRRGVRPSVHYPMGGRLQKRAQVAK